MEKDKAIESRIRLFTDGFELLEIDVARIDRDASLSNQNRRDTALDPNNLTRMDKARDCGIAMPPIVVNQAGDKYLIIDGNHRTYGHRSPTIWAYVVKVDDTTYRQMCKSANAWNGATLKDEDRLQNAMSQVDEGLTISVVAGIWGLEAPVLSHEIRRRDGKRKAKAAGVTVTNNTVAEQINRLELSQIKALGAALSVAAGPEVQQAVKAILDAPAERRGAVALKQAGVLEQKQIEKRKPKARAKQSMSVTQARVLAKKLLDGILRNRSLLNDSELATMLTRLLEVSSEPQDKAA